MNRPFPPPASGLPGAVIGALHLPDLRSERGRSIAFLEDYALTNAAVFADAGVPALMIQDQTREPGPARAETVAVVSALTRLVRAAHPHMALGIIVQAHDAEAPLAIAHASGASFVRLKVFVGASMTAEGPKTGLGIAAASARAALGRPDLAIFADVFDRTSVPISPMSETEAASWAVKLGADGLVLTGDSFADSLRRLREARAAGIRRPLLLGGGVTEGNVAEAFGAADGVIVSTALMKSGTTEADTLRWDASKTRGFMGRATAALAAKGLGRDA